jgi:hypothetical protein
MSNSSRRVRRLINRQRIATAHISTLRDDFNDEDYSPSDPHGLNDVDDAIIHSDDSSVSRASTPVQQRLINVQLTDPRVQANILQDITLNRANNNWSQSSFPIVPVSNSNSCTLSNSNSSTNNSHSVISNNNNDTNVIVPLNNNNNSTNDAMVINNNDPALTVKEIISAIKAEKRRIAWVIGNKLNNVLRKLVKRCTNTRNSYYTNPPRRGHTMKISRYPCNRCGLPLSTHRASPVCKHTKTIAYQSANVISDRYYCGTCGHDWTLHVNDPVRRSSNTVNAVDLTTEDDVVPDTDYTWIGDNRVDMEQKYDNEGNNNDNNDNIPADIPADIPPYTPARPTPNATLDFRYPDRHNNYNANNNATFTNRLNTPSSSIRVTGRVPTTPYNSRPRNAPNRYSPHSSDSESSNDDGDTNSYNSNNNGNGGNNGGNTNINNNGNDDPDDPNDPGDNDNQSDDGDSSNNSNERNNGNNAAIRIVCPITYERIIAMCTRPNDYLVPCTICHQLPDQHSKTKVGNDSKDNKGKSFKMPAREQFPTFRDHNDDDMRDPRLFFRKLVRCIRYHEVPPNRYLSLLVTCMPDDLLAAWVEDNIVKENLPWNKSMELFTAKQTDTNLESQLVSKLAAIRMYPSERSYKYIERYTTLLNRLGYSVKAHDRVVDCERGLTSPLRNKLAEFKASQHAATGNTYECKSIMHLRDLVAILEKGQVALPGKDGGTNSRYKYNDNNHNNNKDNNEKPRYPKRRYDEINAITPTDVPSKPPKTPKINSIIKNNHNNNNKKIAFAVNGILPTKTKWPSKSTKYNTNKSNSNSNSNSNNNNRVIFPPCSHCGLTSHAATTCHYPEGCNLCNKQGHRFYNCPTKPSPPNMYAMNNISVYPYDGEYLDRSIQFNNISCSHSVGITSPQIGSGTTNNVLLDTGAQLSAINANIVKRNHLYIYPIKLTDPQNLSLASAGQYVKRLGYIMLPLTISFVGGKAPIKLQQKLEVLHMSYDYLLGIDVLPLVFPHDEIMHYMGITPSSAPTVNTLNYDNNNVPLVDNTTLYDYVESCGSTITMNRIVSEIEGNINISAIPTVSSD